LRVRERYQQRFNRLPAQVPPDLSITVPEIINGTLRPVFSTHQ